MTSLLAQGLLDGEEKSSTFELYSRTSWQVQSARRASDSTGMGREGRRTDPGLAGLDGSFLPMQSRRCNACYVYVMYVCRVVCVVCKCRGWVNRV